MRNLEWEERLLEIAGARTLEQLSSARETEQKCLQERLADSPADKVIVTLNELHDALIARALMLAENDMARSGFGAPPVPYAYMLYGSGGRFEQTMHSDQDSGLIYSDASDEADEVRNRDYFLKLAGKAVEFLVVIGYPPCEGNVIASNPQWCLSVKEWARRIDHWFAEPNWENVRYLLIAADGRPVWGDRTLAELLRDRYFNDLVRHPVIAHRMLENTLRHKVLVGVFGQLLKERYGEEAGSLDIKYGAYIPMVNAFRLMAMQAGIHETSTLDRIRALLRAGALEENEAKEAIEAFTLFLELRLYASVTEEGGRIVGSGKIPASRLTKEMIGPLKKALKTGSKMQRKVQRELQYRFGGR
ncbi:DUF294 nucleotidyltransferase-like domain-containing protein [Cohnella boryungensis]|uniref:DUF294 nucleotidyltransferase-like domain-containing protein n=1 Tax=Cohnella boryungensis TaxID=768479 RepID=A0ABV8SG65_9BACL